MCICSGTFMVCCIFAEILWAEVYYDKKMVIMSWNRVAL